MTTHDTYECDVLVIGSGAAGLSAAVTAGTHGLEVLVVEKEAKFGGTTARSGGWLWIPGTSLARSWGIDEPPELARTCIRREAGDAFDAERVDAFLENGPKAVDFFLAKTALRFDMPLVFPDYHAEAPGGTQCGRSMIARPFDGRELGAGLKDLAPALPELTVFGVMLGSGKEILHFMRATRSLKSAIYVTKRLSKHFFETLRYGRGMTLTNGNALAGRLAKSAFDLGIPLWVSSPARELIVAEAGVGGAVVEHEGRSVRVIARRGIVLAAGGFPHDLARRKQLFPHAPTGAEHYSPAPSGNTGDGLRLAEVVGGQVDTTLPHAAAWCPVSVTTRTDGTKGLMPHFIDRAKPGVIAVTLRGKRFTNEGDSYHDFVQAMFAACVGEKEVSVYLLCDHRTLRKYGLGTVAPSPLPIGRYLRSGYLVKGATISDLGRKIGIDPVGLEQTVRDYNLHAREGKDPAFGKGTTAYNRYLGDALHGPNPCIAPLEKAPYYAIKIVVGDLGTYAGLITDPFSRVLDRGRQPIPGLYAAGNDIASIMGGSYPGAGITLGPALTFGHIAACHLAGVPTGVNDTKSGAADSLPRTRASAENRVEVTTGAAK
jgi:succinate dehydrogenase/fumarate reductase flavoprotein subunit